MVYNIYSPYNINMAAGIKDVAKLANTSISTVSRVMNDSNNVNPELKNRVLDAITKLDYKPNIVAQSLRSNTLKSIGVAISRSSNPEYTSNVLQSICKTMNEHEYNIILNQTKNPLKETAQCVSLAQQGLAQGFILVGSKIHDDLMEELYQNNIPFVVIGKIANPKLESIIPHVDTDNFSDCKDSTNFLFQNGHKHIGILHSDLEYVVSNDRLNGFIASHQFNNIPLDYNLIVNGGYTIEEAANAAMKLLTSSNPPTAIFATDDLKAIGCYQAATKLGMQIPADISIMGHNNYIISNAISPTLTTIDVPVTQLGETASKLLLDLINHKDVPISTILPTTLIKRFSIQNLSK